MTFGQSGDFSPNLFTLYITVFLSLSLPTPSTLGILTPWVWIPGTPTLGKRILAIDNSWRDVNDSSVPPLNLTLYVLNSPFLTLLPLSTCISFYLNIQSVKTHFLCLKYLNVLEFRLTVKNDNSLPPSTLTNWPSIGTRRLKGFLSTTLNLIWAINISIDQ